MSEEEKLLQLVAQYEPKQYRYLYSIIKKDNDLLTWINEKVPESTYLPEQLYCIVNNISPICENGNRKKFKDSWAGYYRCGKSACMCWKENQSKKLKIAKQSMSTEEWDVVLSKQRATNLKRYGTEYTVQNEEIKSKIVATNLKRYGVKTTLLVPEVQAKIKETLLIKYGVDSPLKSEKLKNKMQDTNLKKYGHIVYPHSKEGRVAVRATLKKRYNVSSIAQLKFSQEVRDLLQDVKRFHEEYFKIGIIGLCEKYPELNYEMCRAKLLREGVTDVIKFTKPELFIKHILDSNDISYQFNTRKIIPPYELDFYIPEYNLAIEACGLYWHNEAVLNNKNYHVNKLDNCLKKGIQLITIFNNYINDCSNAVVNHVLSTVNKMPSYNEELNIVDNCNKLNITNFLNEQHVHSAKTGSINVTALDKDGYICAAMTFGRKGPGIFEIYRFVTIRNIPNIAREMFSFFVKKYNPNSVIVYADRCWNEGGLYIELGFKKVYTSKPKYWYTNDYVHKVSQSEFIKQHDTKYKIYDCGMNKYSWVK